MALATGYPGTGPLTYIGLMGGAVSAILGAAALTIGADVGRWMAIGFVCGSFFGGGVVFVIEVFE